MGSLVAQGPRSGCAGGGGCVVVGCPERLEGSGQELAEVVEQVAGESGFAAPAR